MSLDGSDPGKILKILNSYSPKVNSLLGDIFHFSMPLPQIIAVTQGAVSYDFMEYNLETRKIEVNIGSIFSNRNLVEWKENFYVEGLAHENGHRHHINVGPFCLLANELIDNRETWRGSPEEVENNYLVLASTIYRESIGYFCGDLAHKIFGFNGTSWSDFSFSGTKDLRSWTIKDKFLTSTAIAAESIKTARLLMEKSEEDFGKFVRTHPIDALETLDRRWRVLYEISRDESLDKETRTEIVYNQIFDLPYEGRPFSL